MQTNRILGAHICCVFVSPSKTTEMESKKHHKQSLSSFCFRLLLSSHFTRLPSLIHTILNVKIWNKFGAQINESAEWMNHKSFNKYFPLLASSSSLLSMLLSVVHSFTHLLSLFRVKITTLRCKRSMEVDNTHNVLSHRHIQHSTLRDQNFIIASMYTCIKHTHTQLFPPV